MVNTDAVFNAYLELLKISIENSNHDFDFSALTDDDWEGIESECFSQATSLLCFDSIKNINIKLNDNIYSDWFLKATKILKRNFKIMQQQELLCNLLSTNQIPYVILKGTSSAYYYPNSEYRNFGDIDFLVDSANVERTKLLLLENDYILEEDTSSIHFEFRKNDVRIELHKTISGLPDNKFRSYFECEISTITANGVLVNGFCKPSDYHHAIVIYLHTLHHLLYNGIGMRHLCDWACFVNKTYKDAFWTDKFIPLLKSTGTYKFMCGLTSASVKLLNIDKPNWCENVSEDMVETIVSEVCSAGHFGLKKTVRNSSLMLGNNSEKSSVLSKISNMIKALNKTNHIVCPLIKKIPIIYPFLMLYRAARYLVLMCMGKRQSLIKTSKYADERSAVFAKYELYNVDK